MKLLSWVNNKLNGRQSSNNTNIYATNRNQTAQIGAEKEEFSDWPQGFLSIGTLFIKPIKEDNIKDEQNVKSLPSQNPILDFTLEEVKELQKELNALMSSNTQSSTSIKEEEEEESTSIKEEKEEEEWDDDHQQQFSTIVPNNKAKDKIYSENYGNKAMVNKKSLSFLLKKMFICGSIDGLRPTYSLRYPTNSGLPKTRLSKMLRALIRKKIYPHNSSCPTMKRGKKYLGSGQIGSISNYEEDDDFDTQGNNTIKWDKTDTEYIVLEI
ncbi:protein DEEPER ROOTING 1-like isoform X2 [Amaranthus tricolor]|uniref:protein DEEPER ROOTING 1-like isoform X2 n=1 Tax=Amaranthus tricolor TaxID=29722 RepID=UPI002586F7B7|nr:protein DEEPER ROOTING 1-like isoform X2 [Amaranthus tricolor]